MGHRRIPGSALVTLGFSIGDVGAWLFALWLCTDWFFNLDLLTEAHMKATLNTGMDALAVLWGLGSEQPRHQQEVGRNSKVQAGRPQGGSIPSPHTSFQPPRMGELPGFSEKMARRLTPSGLGVPAQNGMSSSSMDLPSLFSVCFARLRKSTVSAMISQP